MKALETEKSEIIEKRLNAINAHEYDLETKDWCASRLKELDREIGEVKAELLKLGQDNKSKVRTFKQFIELKENLHHYWLAADDTQKRAFCGKLILNLNIKDRKIGSMTWQKPLCNWPKTPKFLIGGASRPCVESYFAALWLSLTEIMEKQELKGLILLAEMLETQLSENKKFCIPEE